MSLGHKQIDFSFFKKNPMLIQSNVCFLIVPGKFRMLNLFAIAITSIFANAITNNNPLKYSTNLYAAKYISKSYTSFSAYLLHFSPAFKASQALFCIHSQEHVVCETTNRRDDLIHKKTQKTNKNPKVLFIELTCYLSILCLPTHKINTLAKCSYCTNNNPIYK